MKTIDWYFDYISPFAYLVSENLHRLPADVTVRPIPILFAGLLQHWHTKGPAEIEPMRRFTFRHISWMAQRDGIPLTLPPAHPFNPLKLLRLCIALDSRLEVAQRLFRFVWAEGHSADDAEQWQALCRELGIENADERIADDAVKSALRHNTERAIDIDLFGVPSLVVDGEIFWGYDAFGFLLDYLQDPDLLDSPAIRAADAMPAGLQRRQD